MIAEQFWSTMNASNQMKSMNKEKFELFLHLKKHYYNAQHKKQLQKDGWTFVPIQYFTTLRDLSAISKSKNISLPETIHLIKTNSSQLTTIKPKSTKVRKIKTMIQQNDQSNQKTTSAKTKLLKLKHKRSPSQYNHQPRKRFKIN